MQHRRAQSPLWYSHTNSPFLFESNVLLSKQSKCLEVEQMEITRDTLSGMSLEQLRLIADFVEAALDSQEAEFCSQEIIV